MPTIQITDDPQCIPWTEEMRKRTSEVLLEIKEIEKEVELNFDAILQKQI